MICKLCDFGTSKFLSHTTKMSVAGTYAWMSPEVIQSQPVCEATDTWSYAVVLWELLTREVPFHGLNDFRIAWMVCEEGVRLPIPASCPKPFATLMRDCWAYEPSRRPDFKVLNILLNSYVINKYLVYVFSGYSTDIGKGSTEHRCFQSLEPILRK